MSNVACETPNTSTDLDMFKRVSFRCPLSMLQSVIEMRSNSRDFNEYASNKLTKRKRSSRQLDGSKQPPSPAQASSRAGSNAGRGFRYQDAVSAWLAVEIWANRRSRAIMIPEGGDDVELRGEETSFIQIKSRRQHLGNYSESETAGFVEGLWNRSLGTSPQPNKLELVLERNVKDLAALDGRYTHHQMENSVFKRLSNFGGASDLRSKTSLIVVATPRELAISLIANQLNCSPIGAQLCFVELLARVGKLADINGTLTPESYHGLSISDTDTLIHDVLAAVDVSAIEIALREGACEPVDFLTPLRDSNFYLGVDVQPGHIAAGLVSERPKARLAILQGVEERRAALIVGPSGAGKSALMWEAAYAVRHTVRWFQIRRLNMTDIPAIRQLIRTFRASEDSPLGFVMDDIGRNIPENWTALLKEVMSLPGVILLGSIREEDISLIPERARAAEVRADPDDELAERLWLELRDAGKTNWAGWKEAWKISSGLILEYVHVLTRGRRMQDLLADQVAARISDSARSVELNILRCGAWAGAANAELDAIRLTQILRVDESDISRALHRIIQEHLVRSPAPGKLTGLHQLRSEELLRLTHQMLLPTLEKSFEWTVASVPATEIELLVDYALSTQRLTVSAVLDGLVVRLEREPDPKALASALRGLGGACISAGVDEWLKTSEVCALPRTIIGTAALFGITDSDFGDRDIIPEVQAAAKRLSRIKGSPKEDPRYLLMERMSPPVLSSLIESAGLVNLNDILRALIGVHLSDTVLTSLKKVPKNLLNAELHLLRSIMGTLMALDRNITLHWVAEVGQETLFKKIQAEWPWAGPVSTYHADDGMIVRCNYWYVAGSSQENPHDDVVNLCELIVALCPSADIVESCAITASGELAGLPEFPLVKKRIPRKNLPPPSVPQWNTRWSDLISRRVAAPNYSNYLARGVVILDALVPTLEKVFDKHLRGKPATESLIKKLNALNEEAKQLTPPKISTFDASGIGSYDANKYVTKLQSIIHDTSVNLIKMFTKLPEQAGAYISWLSDLIAGVNAAISDEPWPLVAENVPPTLVQLKTFLETIRMLAGESHERGEPPHKTWVAHGKKASMGNALRHVSVLANIAAQRRLLTRCVELERAANEEGIDAIFHFRRSQKGILPWPPADLLVLLPARDLVSAVITLDQQMKKLSSLMDNTHLTVIPCIDNVAFPILAIAGYQTLYPDTRSGTTWVEYLGLIRAPSAIAELFGEVLSLAGELSAMDRLRLGTETRPQVEIDVRKSLNSSFVDKKEKLTIKLNTFDRETQTNVFEMVEKIRTENIDFVAEAQNAINGLTSEVMGKIVFLRLLLIELEWLSEPGQAVEAIEPEKNKNDNENRRR